MNWITEKNPEEFGIYLVRLTHEKTCLARWFPSSDLGSQGWYTLNLDLSLHVIGWQHVKFAINPNVNFENDWVTDRYPQEQGFFLIKKTDDTVCFALRGMSCVWYDTQGVPFMNVKGWKYANFPQSSEFKKKPNVWVCKRFPPVSGIYLAIYLDGSVFFVRYHKIGHFANVGDFGLWYDLKDNPFKNSFEWQFADFPQDKTQAESDDEDEDEQDQKGWITDKFPENDGIYLITKRDDTISLGRFFRCGGFNHWLDVNTDLPIGVKAWQPGIFFKDGDYWERWKCKQDDDVEEEMEEKVEEKKPVVRITIYLRNGEYYPIDIHHLGDIRRIMQYIDFNTIYINGKNINTSPKNLHSVTIHYI